MENNNKILQNLDNQFIDSNLSSISYQGTRENYLGSEKQKNIVKSLFSSDAEFKDYIEDLYGSFDEYEKTKISFSSEFDPASDYTVDVSIISSDQTLYSSDHISPGEVIVELLNGVCTFFYIKVNGSSGKSTGSLNSKFLPASEYSTRKKFFIPLPSDRIVLWDVEKQQWNSFYMSRLIKFIRDETSDLQ